LKFCVNNLKKFGIGSGLKHVRNDIPQTLRSKSNSIPDIPNTLEHAQSNDHIQIFAILMPAQCEKLFILFRIETFIIAGSYNPREAKIRFNIQRFT